MIRVQITGTGSFLPNDPVPNDRLEDVLGPLNDAPPRVRKFVDMVGPQILARGGIESRHFAIDSKTRRLTHTVATMAEESARRAIADAHRAPADVELLVLSSPNYDQMTPPTSAILQELLGIESCAELEIHSNCTGVGKSVQVAYDALRAGRYKTALVTYVQFSSVNLRSCYFNQEQMTKTQAALRYILADASGSVFLEAIEGDGRMSVPHEVVGTFVESIGGKRQPGMTAGGSVADLTEDGDPITSIYGRGTHHLSQDFAAVNRDAGPLLCDGVARMLSSLDVDPKTVPHYIYSIPTRQLYEENVKRFVEQLGVTREQAKFRAQRTGYCGGASLLLHLDEMARSGELQPGQLVVLHSVESSKWMSAGFVARW